MRRVSIPVKRSLRGDETIEIRIWGGSRPEMWIGSDEKAGFCRLTRSEVVKLRDALDALWIRGATE